MLKNITIAQLIQYGVIYSKSIANSDLSYSPIISIDNVLYRGNLLNVTDRNFLTLFEPDYGEKMYLASVPAEKNPFEKMKQSIEAFAMSNSRFQELYNEHPDELLRILNNLISVIDQPDEYHVSPHDLESLDGNISLPFIAYDQIQDIKIISLISVSEN